MKLKKKYLNFMMTISTFKSLKTVARFSLLCERTKLTLNQGSLESNIKVVSSRIHEYKSKVTPNSLPNDKIWSKLKAFADDKMNVNGSLIW